VKRDSVLCFRFKLRSVQRIVIFKGDMFVIGVKLISVLEVVWTFKKK